ncbi:hypothetical protein CMK20_18935 [Candidatus Poribacteria bacterium]|nr:hypothetical protein [Candidatus Poribacteria bacterium]
MGIKGLTKIITKYSPDSIHSENLYKLSGKKIAVDASLLIYKQLKGAPNVKVFRNSNGKITNHITGLFYKIMNYVSLNIELIFIFDGKPPDNKQLCIDERKEKSKKSLEEANKSISEEEKHKHEKNSLRITKEIINDVKTLLKLMGIPYIHPEEGEGEAYASELCRIGYVDYVLTEDMDTMAYGCPKLIRKCIDKSCKRNDIISIFDYSKIIKDLELNQEEFLDFCILCGCDYCPVVPRIGAITALKLIKKYKTIDNIVLKNNNYDFPKDYIDQVNCAKYNFKRYKGSINIEDLNIIQSVKDINGLKDFLIKEIEMNEKRVNNSIKKYSNTYK